MKKVLVTGADGFIGSHLVEYLVQKGFSVRALCQYNSFNSWGWAEEFDAETMKKVEIVCGDIRDEHFCQNLCKDIHYVFHLAALIAIPYSYQAPYSYIDTNVKGTANLCTAALKNNVERFIQTSTSEVYGTAQYIPINEQHPLQPQSPYSASKIAADAISMSFYYSFDLPVIVARPFNTYGPRQSARAIIPTVITQIASGMKDILVGDTSPTRDFNFVQDTCRAFLLLAESKKSVGEVVNIGSNYEISIQGTMELIRDLMQKEVRFVKDENRIRPQKSEVKRLWCDNTRLKELTGFSPAFDLASGLKKTIEWFSQPENLKRYKPGIYNV